MSKIIIVPILGGTFSIPIENIESYEASEGGCTIYVKNENIPDGVTIVESTVSFEELKNELTKAKKSK